MKFIPLHPKKASATKVQCEIYRMLTNIGIECDVEYKASDSCRFDLVLVKGLKIIGIIETKRKPRKSKINTDSYKETKQYKKYIAFGLPVFYIRGLEELETKFKEIVNFYNES